MSQAVRDLPDPLDPSPSLATSDPDDLLAKMADEAIDRLIADADNGKPLSLPPLPPDKEPAVKVVAEPEPSSAADPSPAATSFDEAKNETAPASGAGTTDASIADNRFVSVEQEPAKPDLVGSEAKPAVSEAPPVEAEHVAVEEPPPVVTETVTPAPVDAPSPTLDRQALLADAPVRPSIWLWPLWLVNLPFAWIGENARRVFGLIGIVTLVPAIAAIVYVLWLKHRWGG